MRQGMLLVVCLSLALAGFGFTMMRGYCSDFFCRRSMFLPLAIAVLTLHLLLAGVAAAGPIVAGIAQWRAIRRDHQGQQSAARSLARWSLFSLFAAIGLGFLLGALYRMQAGTEFETRGVRLRHLAHGASSRSMSNPSTR